MIKMHSIAVLFFFCSVSPRLMADGKMYWPESVSPTIPYQRALIFYKQGVQTLFLQSQYEIPEQQNAAVLGWVVPVPAVPEVASMPAEGAQHLFFRVDFRSRAKIISSGGVLLFLSVLVVAGLLLNIFLLTVFSKHMPIRWLAKNRQRLIFYLIVVFVILALVSLITPALSTVKEGVKTIAEHRVGIYNVRVIRSDDAAELITWLNANQFRYDETDQTLFADYIAKGWCFVVAHIDPLADQEKYEIVSRGLAAPLILRFPITSPVYPLALTGTTGHETKVLVYLFADHKMICNDRLTLRFCGQVAPDFFPSYVFDAVQPQGFFAQDDLSYTYLCKFRDTLRPEQMQDDIVFTRAKDNTFYREFIFKW
jgi:hypothetical protein